MLANSGTQDPKKRKKFKIRKRKEDAVESVSRCDEAPMPKKELPSSFLDSSESGTLLLRRCGGSYLEKRNFRINETIGEIGWLWTLWYGITGRWLVVSEQSCGALNAQGIKQSVFDQHVNLAIVSALLLTVEIPLALEFASDYLEEGSTNSLFNGAVAKLLNQNIEGEEWLDDWIGYLEEFGLLCYGFASLCNFTAVLLCCFILLSVIELQSDVAVVGFVKSMGRLYSIPYVFWVVGSYLPFPPLIVRSLLMLRTWTSIGSSSPIFTVMTFFGAAFMAVSVKRTVNTVLNKEKYGKNARLMFVHIWHMLGLTLA